MSAAADFVSSAVDVASDVLSDGVEFLSDGFNELTEQVGSFAGNADWFTENAFGDILGGPEPLGFLGGAGFSSPFDSFTDFFGDIRTSIIGPELLAGPGSSTFGIGSIVSSIPGVSSITAALPSGVTNQLTSTVFRTGTNLINSQIASLPVVGQVAAPVFRSLAGSVNPAIAQTPGFNPTAISLSQITGITPNIGIPNVPGIQVAQLGNNISIDQIRRLSGPVNTLVNPQASTALISEPPGTPQETPTAVSSDLITVPTLDTINESNIDRSASNVGYITSFDPETQTYAVVNEQTGLPVATGLTEQQAILTAQDQTFIDAGDVPPGETVTGGIANINRGANTTVSGQGLTVAYDEDGNLLPGYTLNEDNNPVFVGGDFVEPATAAQAEADRIAALRDQARQQQTIRAQRQNQAQAGDWRVRLRLAPTSNYLYNAPDCGPVLWPLRNTDGVIFPYTPQIDMAYKANYQPYDLTHSNYRGYFYKNSAIDAINIRGIFTAQDTKEANYLLAVIHFFRSATKMFYGQDAERGSPPPLTYLSGFGDYQFNEHPCLISQFNYSLPADVNYIRAQSVLTGADTNLLNARSRQTSLGNPLSYALQRLSTIGMSKGGLDAPFAPGGSLGAGNPTYVPTKIEISLTLLPTQSRSQVSKQFSVKSFANGNLLKGGFW
jgi:hypothetical protein